jgi:transposase-like protein
VRLQAAEMFEQDVNPVQVAREMRVSTKSAYQWRRCWRAGGKTALASKGAGGAACRLSAAQLVSRLRAALDQGPCSRRMYRVMSAPSGTVTLFYTDIEGSARLWEGDETAMRAALFPSRWASLRGGL